MIYRLLLLLSALLATQLQMFAQGMSATTNGIYLVVDAAWHVTDWPPTNKPVRFDDRLVWMTFCDTGKVDLSFPDARYGMKIKMADSDGKEVPETAFGGRWFGSKFDSLHLITDSKVGNTEAWGSYKDNPGLGGALFLPKPKELFQMEKSGVYTMEIQMQMFRYVPSYDPIERSKTLFRFSPIKIKVEKPAEK
jgi:hypothetical protein